MKLYSNNQKSFATAKLFSFLDMLVERAGLEGMSREELMKEINSLPQDQREDLEKLLVKIILKRKEQKPGGR